MSFLLLSTNFYFVFLSNNAKKPSQPPTVPGMQRMEIYLFDHSTCVCERVCFSLPHDIEIAISQIDEVTLGLKEFGKNNKQLWMKVNGQGGNSSMLANLPILVFIMKKSFRRKI